MEPSSIALKKTFPWLTVLLAASASLGFGYLAFSGIEVNVVLQAMSRVSAGAIATALLLFLLGTTLRIIRWWLLLRHFQPDLPLSTCVQPFLLGIAANDFLPVRVGDLVKMFANHEAILVPPSTRLGTIIVERLFDTISILLFFFLGALQLNIPSFAKYMPVAYGALILSVGALLLALFCSKIAEKWCHALLNLRPIRDRKMFCRAQGWTSQFFQTFASLRSKSLTGLFLLSCLIWGVEGTMALIIAWAIDPTSGILGPYLSLACGALSSLLPSAPGMIGTLDYFLTLGVLSYGMDKSSAAAFAILMHTVFLGFSAMAAAVILSRKSAWIMLRGFTQRQHFPDNAN